MPFWGRLNKRLGTTTNESACPFKHRQETFPPCRLAGPCRLELPCWVSPLWRPAPPIAARLNPAPSSRAIVHDVGLTIAVAIAGPGVGRCRYDDYGWGRIVGSRANIDWRGFRHINPLCMRTGRSYQRQRRNHSCQHSHGLLLLFLGLDL